MSAIARTATKVFSAVALKRPARKLSLSDLAIRLEESGKNLESRYGAALDTPTNREKVRHIVGIERWGQRRLEVFLGKEAVDDEYDGYQPSASASWRDLKLAFANTRRRTVEMARQLDKAKIADDRTVAHNAQGELAAREWLYYLRFHADFESRRIK
jgi:hypothetical protein